MRSEASRASRRGSTRPQSVSGRLRASEGFLCPFQSSAACCPPVCRRPSLARGERERPGEGRKVFGLDSPPGARVLSVKSGLQAHADGVQGS